MKSLSAIIKENRSTDLYDYIQIDEGLLQWLKKLWKRLTGQIEKNKEDHGGYYDSYDFARKEIQRGKPSAAQSQSSQSGSFMQQTAATTFAAIKLDNANFENALSELRTKDGVCPFQGALEHYKENKDQAIILFSVSLRGKSDYLCIMFGDRDKNKYYFKRSNIFWNTVLLEGSGTYKTYKNQFTRNDIAGSYLADALNVDVDDVTIENSSTFGS